MAEIRIKIQDEHVQSALAHLSGKMANLSPVMKIIGEYLVRSTDARFSRQGPAPDGTPWAPLKKSTLARKRSAKILTESGALRGDIHYMLIGTNGVSVGTTDRVPYAAIHQLGGRTPARTIRPVNKKALSWPGAAHPVNSVNHPGSVIPARPFLGVSAQDSDTIVGYINRYLEMRGA